MEFETSFDEYSMGDSAKRFIALEVSDHEEDYNSSLDSIHDMVTEDVDIMQELHNVENTPSSTTVVSTQNHVSIPAQNTDSNPIRASSKRSKDEKKRWSFISTNSSTKKRWSTLSFTSETKSSKRLSVVSTESTSKRSSIQSVTNQSPANKLKRSSTGTSLRSMFNKIVLKDEDKENAGVLAHKRTQTVISTASSTTGFNTTNLRPPLVAINQNARRDQRLSHVPMSPSMDNMSIITQQSNASMGSRWKFWKKKQDFADYGYNQGSNVSMRSKSSLSDLRKSIFQNSKLVTSDSTQDLKLRKSHSSLQHKSSHSSLKQKTSHASLKKLQSRRNSSTASNESSSPQISLPIPDQVSRDKIRTKLRHSSSLMSINSNMLGGSVIIAETDEYDETTLQQLLGLCTVKNILPFNKSPNLRQLNHYIYLDTKDSTVYKIIPLDNDDRECKMTRQMRLQELQLTTLLSGTPGFTNILDTKIVKREIDQNLFLIYHMKNHGVSLNEMITNENRIFTTDEIKDIIIQCIRALYVAETKFQFEHRLLTLDHVLLDRTGNVTLIDYKLSRANYGSQVLFTRLDHPLFFEFRKDYNSTLQWLRQSMTVDSWPLFHPKTNLVWLSYIISKLRLHSAKPTAESPVLDKIQTCLETSRSRKLWKRNDGIIESCADIVGML